MALSIAFVRWDIFILVLVRVASMVMVAPVLGAKPIPVQVKVGLSVLLAMLLTPLQPATGPLLTEPLSMLLAISREVVVGLLLGFVGVLVFAAVQMAAQLIGVQIGFGFSNTMNPLSAEGSSFLDSLYSLMAVIVFLGLGGHHALIAGLSRSFELAPLGQYSLAPVVGDRLVDLSTRAMAAGSQLAMPIVGTVLLTDAAMALVMRTIPQMNVFAVGLPVKMVVGMLSLSAVAPLTVAGLSNLSRAIASAVAGVLS